MWFVSHGGCCGCSLMWCVVVMIGAGEVILTMKRELRTLGGKLSVATRLV